MRRTMGVFAGVIAMAVIATACSDGSGAGGGGYGGGMYGGGGTTPTGASAGAATIGTADSDLGTVLVDADGHTLYLFEQDTGSSSTCTGDCATTWPPVITSGDATAVDGASGSLGTTTRDDGTTQVTYDGHPLYRYSGDAAAGDTNGQGIGGVWFASTPEGTAAAGGGPGETPSRGGYG